MTKSFRHTTSWFFSWCITVDTCLKIWPILSHDNCLSFSTCLPAFIFLHYLPFTSFSIWLKTQVNQLCLSSHTIMHSYFSMITCDVLSFEQFSLPIQLATNNHITSTNFPLYLYILHCKVLIWDTKYLQVWSVDFSFKWWNQINHKHHCAR